MFGLHPSCLYTEKKRQYADSDQRYRRLSVLRRLDLRNTFRIIFRLCLHCRCRYDFLGDGNTAYGNRQIIEKAELQRLSGNRVSVFICPCGILTAGAIMIKNGVTMAMRLSAAPEPPATVIMKAASLMLNRIRSLCG